MRKKSTKSKSVKITREIRKLYQRRDRSLDRSDVPQLSPQQWAKGENRQILSADQSANLFPLRCGCPGLAEVKGRRTFEPDQHYSPGADDGRGQERRLTREDHGHGHILLDKLHRLC